MSQSDSFIEEVTEEVRRDRLFLLLRRWGWVAVLAILLLVGGAAWNEYRKAQDRAEAEALGDAILAALESDTPEARIDALRGIQTDSAGGQALLRLLTASEEANADKTDEAAATLEAVATDGALPQIYRDIAGFRALLARADSAEPAELRTGFENFARPGHPLRLLAEEQLALLDLRAGDSAAALARLAAILEDSEVTAGLRQRATQLIVALGGDPVAATDGTGAGTDTGQ